MQVNILPDEVSPGKGGGAGSASRITQTVVVLQKTHPCEVSLNVS